MTEDPAPRPPPTHHPAGRHDAGWDMPLYVPICAAIAWTATIAAITSFIWTAHCH